MRAVSHLGSPSTAISRSLWALAHLLIHCHAGICRATAAALLLAPEDPSRPAAHAER